MRYTERFHFHTQTQSHWKWLGGRVGDGYISAVLHQAPGFHQLQSVHIDEPGVPTQGQYSMGGELNRDLVLLFLIVQYPF